MLRRLSLGLNGFPLQMKTRISFDEISMAALITACT
jgi:hypothetical protein